MWVAGIRPYHQITRNFAMQYELGYEYLDDKNYKGVNGKGKGGLTKVTVAPTLTFDSGFWARPQLRFFVTYAKWDKGVPMRWTATTTGIPIPSPPAGIPAVALPTPLTSAYRPRSGSKERQR